MGSRLGRRLPDAPPHRSIRAELPHTAAALTEAGIATICIETRQAKAAMGAMPNKTDRNDARGIAQIMRTGW